MNSTAQTLHGFRLLFCSSNYWPFSALPALALHALSPTPLALPIPLYVFPLCCRIYSADHLLRDTAVPTHFPSALLPSASPCSALFFMPTLLRGPDLHTLLFHGVFLLPTCSQVSAAVAAEVQDARRRPPAGLPLQASHPCGPLSPPWPSHQAMVPSLAFRSPRNTHR